MSMFQNSVLKNYSQDEVLVATWFAQYQKFKKKIEFIKGVKEERKKTGNYKERKYFLSEHIRFGN